MNLIAATYKVLYDNKNITKDISDHLISLSYTDKVEGESDEIEIVLEDADLLWQNDWYPKKGAKLTVFINHDNLELSCGSFTIDEIEMSKDRSSGDTVTIRGLAAFITKKMRTRHSVAHENKTLREVCNSIAAKHGLTVEGTIANITLQRITQLNETDLHFLHRLAADFGYTFSIRDTKMTFTSIYELESKSHILSIDKTDLISWSLKDKTTEVFKKANIKHHSPQKNETIEASEDYNDTEFERDDTLEIRDRVENTQQAEAKSKSALHKKNSLQKSGSISLPGNVLLVAGVNFELTGMGTLSGVEHIISSVHTVDRSGGYLTTAEIKAVAPVAQTKWKPKIKKQRSNTVAVGNDNSLFNYMRESLILGSKQTQPQ